MFDYIVRLLVWAVEGEAKVSLHPLHTCYFGVTDLFPTWHDRTQAISQKEQSGEKKQQRARLLKSMAGEKKQWTKRTKDANKSEQTRKEPRLPPSTVSGGDSQVQSKKS